jgi:hydrogenase/urease accessory protein HupE
MFIAAILQYGFVDSSSSLSELASGRPVCSIAYALWVAIRPLAAGGRFRVVIEAPQLAVQRLSPGVGRPLGTLDPLLSVISVGCAAAEQRGTDSAL